MNFLGRQHWAIADLLTLGDSPAGLGLMMPLATGFEFPWREGGVALLRRELYPETGAWQYCGLAIGEDGTISNYPGMTHAAGQSYQYTAVAFLGSGMISSMSPPIRIDFDDEGALIDPPLPGPPGQVIAQAQADGAYRVRWEYDRFGQGGAPTDFQVFEGATSATVDYGTPLTDADTGLDYVPYIGSRRLFSFLTAGYGHGTPHVFAVRGRNVDGIVEQNTRTTQSAKARATAPTAAPAPLRAYVEGRSRLGG